MVTMFTKCIFAINLDDWLGANLTEQDDDMTKPVAMAIDHIFKIDDCDTNDDWWSIICDNYPLNVSMGYI